MKEEYYGINKKTRKHLSGHCIEWTQGRRYANCRNFHLPTRPDQNRKAKQKALEKFVFEFEDKVKSGKYLTGEKMTYKQFIELWLKD